jgi:predicted nucleic acid-binding protein
MRRIFVDSSVLFSAVYSSSGHSSDLLTMSAVGEITAVVSEFVITETRRNILELKPDRIAVLDRILNTANLELKNPTTANVAKAAQLIILKDAPIIAAAKTAKVDMLVSLDRRHILGKPELEAYIGAPILTPIEAFQKLKLPK